MKYIKILIFLIVLSIIAFEVYQKPEVVEVTSENLITNTEANIKAEIIKFSSITSVRKIIHHYDNIFYSINHTNFDTDDANNKSTIQNLNRDLYAAYAPRFLALSKSYLNKRDWSNEDVGFIQNAAESVLNSPLLDAISSLPSQYKPLMDALKLRNNIVVFLRSVNGISTLCPSINVDFPDYTSLIAKSSSHIVTINGNGLMKKCVGLKDRLRNVSNDICAKHVTYLENMIRRSSHRYFPSYVSLTAYSENVKDPITKKIDRLGKLSSVYGKSKSDIGVFQSNLNSKLDKVYIDAYNYIDALNNNETHDCKYPN